MTITGLPQWLEYTIVGILIVYFMFACGKILAKTGHSPAWCLLLFVPYVQIIALWAFAYKKWPVDQEKDVS